MRRGHKRDEVIAILHELGLEMKWAEPTNITWEEWVKDAEDRYDIRGVEKELKTLEETGDKAQRLYVQLCKELLK